MTWDLFQVLFYDLFIYIPRKVPKTKSCERAIEDTDFLFLVDSRVKTAGFLWYQTRHDTITGFYVPGRDQTMVLFFLYQNVHVGNYLFCGTILHRHLRSKLLK